MKEFKYWLGISFALLIGFIMLPFTLWSNRKQDLKKKTWYEKTKYRQRHKWVKVYITIMLLYLLTAYNRYPIQ